MSGYIPVAIQRRVRERFGNRCAYCQTAELLTATTFEFEHIVPRSVRVRRMGVAMAEHPPALE